MTPLQRIAVVPTLTGLFLLLTSASCRSARDGYDEASPAFVGDAAVEACGRVRCSPDLRSIVSACDGSVVRECPPEQGCGNGDCVAACESAGLAQGSPGCAFWTVPPPAQCSTRGSCFAMMVSNTWATPADLSVEYDGKVVPVASFARIPRPSPDGRSVDYLPLDGPLAPGGQAILFLFSAPAPTCLGPGPIDCPSGVRPLLLGTNEYLHKAEASQGKAFGLRSTVPVAAYSVYPYGGAPSYVPSATLLYPERSLSTNYLALNAWEDTGSTHIVATQNDTDVTITPANDLLSSQGSGPRGVPIHWKLQRGQTLQLDDTGDAVTYGAASVMLNGSPIVSDKPVAVFGGTQCVNIGKAACDSALQQLPPIATWGHRYAAVSYGGRGAADELVPWRIQAAVDGTVLTFDPEPPTGAKTLMNGKELVVLSASKPFTVTSQDKDHPFFVSGHMTGGESFDGEGDPEFVSTVALDQFLDSYVFYVDYSYASSRLVFVRVDDGSGFKDVELDCAGVLTGFQPVGSSGRVQYARVDLNHLGVATKVGDKTCALGRHEAKSAGRFGITVWGWDQYASYAYPGGASVRPLSGTTVGVVR